MPSTFEGEVLLLNNADVEKLLSIERVIAALKEESRWLLAKYSKQNNETFLESSYVGNEPIYERVPLVTREGMEIQIKEAIGRRPKFNLKTDDIIDDSLVLQLE
jgi:hypothetical protein